jgi:hypothetical protein
MMSLTTIFSEHWNVFFSSLEEAWWLHIDKVTIEEGSERGREP